MSFLLEMLRHPKDVGRITPSSGLVARALLAPVDFTRAKTVVELGGGTGAITKRLLKRLRQDARLFVFEHNSVFASNLRAIDDHRICVIEESADSLVNELMHYGVESADYVVSTLPMVLMPHPLVEHIVNQAYSIVRPSGAFVQLHHTPFMRPTYQQVFKNVHINVMPLSLPPAFIMVCRKGPIRQALEIPRLR